jgi:hypothetical protein
MWLCVAVTHRLGRWIIDLRLHGSLACWCLVGFPAVLPADISTMWRMNNALQGRKVEEYCCVRPRFILRWLFGIMGLLGQLLLDMCRLLSYLLATIVMITSWRCVYLCLGCGHDERLVLEPIVFVSPLCDVFLVSNNMCAWQPHSDKSVFAQDVYSSIVCCWCNVSKILG